MEFLFLAKKKKVLQAELFCLARLVKEIWKGAVQKVWAASIIFGYVRKKCCFLADVLKIRTKLNKIKVDIFWNKLYRVN